MQGIARAWQKIKPFENAFVVSNVMQRHKLRRIEKVASANPVHCKEITQRCCSPAECSVLAIGSKRPPIAVTLPEGREPRPDFVVAFTTRLDLSPYCVSGAPVISSIF